MNSGLPIVPVGVLMCGLAASASAQSSVDPYVPRRLQVARVDHLRSAGRL